MGDAVGDFLSGSIARTACAWLPTRRSDLQRRFTPFRRDQVAANVTGRRVSVFGSQRLPT